MFSFFGMTSFQVTTTASYHILDGDLSVDYNNPVEFNSHFNILTAQSELKSDSETVPLNKFVSLTYSFRDSKDHFRLVVKKINDNLINIQLSKNNEMWLCSGRGPLYLNALSEQIETLKSVLLNSNLIGDDQKTFAQSRSLLLKLSVTVKNIFLSSDKSKAAEDTLIKIPQLLALEKAELTSMAQRDLVSPRAI